MPYAPQRPKPHPCGCRHCGHGALLEQDAAASKAAPAVIVRGFSRYSNAVDSLPATERAKIDDLGRRLVASYRSRRPIRVVRLIGHADRDQARGTAFERKISEERADTVRQALLESMRRAARSSDVAAQIHWQIAGVG